MYICYTENNILYSDEPGMKRYVFTVLTSLSFLSHTWAEGNNQDKVGTFQPIDCPEEILPDKGEENITCGYLIAPESHLKPTNKMINLFVAIAKSTAAEPNPDPVAFLTGGPGQAASPFVQQAGLNFLQNKRDVIYMDQRGTGRSIPFLPSCVPGESAISIFGVKFNRCKEERKKAGVDFTNFNTVENALDFKMLRESLAINQWNLLGGSYGTRLGLEIMRQDPKGIRSSGFSSLAPPNRDIFSQDRFINQKRVFELMFSDCEKDPKCHVAYPNLKQEFLALENYLDRTSYTFRYINSQGGEIVEETGGFPILLKVLLLDIASVVSRNTLDVPLWTTQKVQEIQEKLNMGRMQTLPDYIHTLYLHYHDGTPLPKRNADRVFGDKDNNATPHENGSKSENKPSSFHAFSTGLHYSILCREDFPFANIAILGELSKHYEPYTYDWTFLATKFVKICKTWGSGVALSSHHDPVASPIPTLIVTGIYDVETPPSWAKATAKYLPNSTSITLPSGGHSAMFTSDCAFSIYLNFLEDPSKKLDTSCVAKLHPPTFVIPEQSEKENPIQTP